MTAEVAVLNRSAVALAADSAVTISGQTSPKVYKTVNKLFTLSKFHRVGIMIYGGADYMAAPWETVIKLYRHSIGCRELDSIAEYAADFRTFVKDKISVTQDDQKRRVRQIWGAFFEYLNSRTRRFLLDAAKRGPLSQKAAHDIFLAVLKAELSMLKRGKILPIYAKVKAADLLAKYDDEFKSACATYLRGRTFKPESTRVLKECAAHVILKDDFRFGISGIVIAGFGKNEVFPCVHKSMWSGTVLDELRTWEDKLSAVSSEDNQRAYLLAFAQREMVARYMEGIDPSYLQYLDGGIRSLVHDVADTLIKKYSSGTAKKKRERSTEVKKTLDKMIKDFSDRSGAFRYKQFTEKMINIVSILPKEEIAELAGSLVEMTSLKRKMSVDAESVGGPIDVAVISKGDGFVWIKRKHYFDPALNHFFARKYLLPNGNQPELED